MRTVSQMATALQAVLTTGATELAKSTGAVVRQRKFTGPSLAQTFVLGWLNKPRATFDELAQMAGICGASVTPQAVANRLTRKLVLFFKELLELATTQVVNCNAGAVALLHRFNGVYFQDSTVIGVPGCFAQEYPGCGGGQCDKNAAVKFQVRWNFLNGQLEGPFPEAGSASDRSSCVQSMPLPRGALRIADLGYFNLKVMADLAAQRVFWISRIQVHTAVFYEGVRWDVCQLLKRQQINAVDLPVKLGAGEQLPCRLLAVRCPPAIVRRRLAALKKDARRRGRTLSKRQLEGCHYTVLVTNVPQARLDMEEAQALYRARWQIELLFKLWKQNGLVDESCHQAAVAQLVEMYAKLLGAIIQHWLLLTTAWHQSQRSLVKASKAIRSHVPLLVAALQSLLSIQQVVQQITQALRQTARVNRRKTKPSTHQTLENPELLGYQLA